MLSDEKIESIANEVGAPASRYFPYWRTTVDLCLAIEAEVFAECAKVCKEKHANGNWKYDTREECAAAIIERSNAAPVVQPGMVQKLRDMLQMLLQEPNTKTALFMAEDMLREMIAAAEGKK